MTAILYIVTFGSFIGFRGILPLSIRSSSASATCPTPTA